MGKAIGLYVHIPFCTSKCHYCAFSVVTDRSRELEYIDAVLSELRIRTAQLPDRTIDTLYFGGGTPSLLTPEAQNKLLSGIFSIIPRSSLCEITMECNPEQVNQTFLADLQELGITRISMGIQTLQDTILQTFNRRHTSRQALLALEALQQSGLTWNADIILGLPGTSPADTLRDLEVLLGYAPHHLSAYFLSVEPGTVLSHMRLPKAADQGLTRLYDKVCKRLVQEGFEHVEISNWARPGHACIHNLHYWRGEEYLGIGLGASSHTDRRLQENTKNFTLYTDGIYQSKPVEQLTEEEYAFLLLTTCTRTPQGLAIAKLCKNLPDSAVNALQIAKCMLEEQGLLLADKDAIRLPEHAFVLHDAITTRLWQAVQESS